MKAQLFTTLLGTLLFAQNASVHAADTEVLIVIKNNRFTPDQIKVAAHQRIKLVVQNQDTEPEEFESHKLNREKLIAPGAKVEIYIGPLEPGRYGFSGDYHEATAQGVIIAE